ncbi:MAG: Hsp70 family protein [Bifidobacteriaceae bacterium]|nr:Hsp70 family protein [Bifidobacteriaceae bacterium]
MAIAVGIDLGTTFSAVAVQRADGKPEILPNREFEETTPSVVFFPPEGDEDLIMVGVEAKNQVAVAGEDVAQFVKRAMGSRDYRFITSGGVEFTAEGISAMILKRLAQDASEALGEEVKDVVVTVPAYFDDARRTATRDAAKIAGLNVLGLLNEPTAAALAFGVETEEEGTFLVYDLGGGTFDVTILVIKGNSYREVATVGDAELGGSDWDNEIVKLICAAIQENGGPDLDLDDMSLVSVLQEKAEQAKRALTANAAASVSVALGGRIHRAKITRAQFEEATAHLLERTEDMTRVALEEAWLTWDDIDEVLLVGGSSKMPMVPALVERLSGRSPSRHIHPDLAVALGAAIQAAVCQANLGDAEETPAQSGIAVAELPQLQHVASQALGVITLADDLRTKVNTVVIKRNAEVPGQFPISVSTVADWQATIRVEVTQGDDKDLSYVTVVGSKDIPIPPYPKNSPFRITYHYDTDQTIFVEVEDLTAGQTLGRFQVERVNNLGDTELEAEFVRVSGLEIA